MQYSTDKPIIAITGPTATGKTALGIQLCQHYGGEIVSCDAMQVYQGLDIGTAKPSQEQLSLAPHHLIGFLDWDTPFSVSDYVAAARTTVNEITDRGHRPILVGGTGLYARMFLQGSSFHPSSRNEQLRNALERQVEQDGALLMHERLKELDPEAALQIHPNNIKRVLRAMEYCLSTGKPLSTQTEENQNKEPPAPYVMICLTARNRAWLYARINDRVDAMMDQGLLDEVRAFYTQLPRDKREITATQAIGYKEFFPYLEGKCTLSEAVERLKRNTRRYAKRQMTWFKREKAIHYLYVDEMNDEQRLKAAITAIDAQENT